MAPVEDAADLAGHLTLPILLQERVVRRVALSNGLFTGAGLDHNAFIGLLSGGVGEGPRRGPRGLEVVRLAAGLSGARRSPGRLRERVLSVVSIVVLNLFEGIHVIG